MSGRKLESLPNFRRLQAFVNAYACYSSSEHHKEIIKACEEYFRITFDETTPPLEAQAAMSIWNTDMKYHTFCRYTRKSRTRTRNLSPPVSPLPPHSPPSPQPPPENFFVLVPGKPIVGDLVAELSTRNLDRVDHRFSEYPFSLSEVVLRQANDVDVAMIEIVLDLPRERDQERDAPYVVDQEIDERAFRLVSVINARHNRNKQWPHSEIIII